MTRLKASTIDRGDVVQNLILLAPLLAGFSTSLLFQDFPSGPERGLKVPEIVVFDATGAQKDKAIDYAAVRKGKTTIYLFINADKFDRPMNRFMKTLDGIIVKDFTDAYVVAIWLGGDIDKLKELLPRIQQSVQYEATALTLFMGDKNGPNGWSINGDAHLTAVVTHDGKVAATFGYQSLNETNVPLVREAVEKAVKK
jgi:hypothetical protein